MSAAAKAAIEHLMRRLLDDPRVAYYFDPFTRSMELLSEAYAEVSGLSVERVRAEIYPRLRVEAPSCRECEHCQRPRGEQED